VVPVRKLSIFVRGKFVSGCIPTTNRKRGGHCAEMRAVCFDTAIEDPKTLISFLILVKLKAVECASNLVQVAFKVSAYA
jgi:hypothetical protein